MSLKNSSKTLFPHFDSSELPEVDESSVSSDDDSVKQARYSTKEDQDVAVFMNIAQHLSVKSLLHLLQGHAQTQSLPENYFAGKVAAQTAKMSRSMLKTVPRTTAKPTPKVKKFRFAVIREEHVRCVVHEIQSYKDAKELWWNPVEMRDIRADAISTMKYYKKRRPEFTKAVEVLASSYSGNTMISQSMIDEQTKLLAKNSHARGLETHIVSLLSMLRHDTVQAVLEEQEECRRCGDDYGVTAESLREQSLAYSVQSRTFATRIADCDHIEALKASLCHWVGSEV